MQSENGSPSRKLCVFCGSSDGAQAEYRSAAATLGRLLGQAGLGLVYGGAQVGLMGALADATLAAGGEVIGVIPRALQAKEIVHTGLTELYVVETMHQRKARMAEEADAFLALPGGFGTLDEFFEILTWAQLGIHSKPCLMLNTRGYFERLLAFLDDAVEQGFLKRQNRALIHLVREPHEVLSVANHLWLGQSPDHRPVAEPAP